MAEMAGGAGPAGRALRRRVDDLAAVCGRLRSDLDLLDSALAPVADRLGTGVAARDVVDPLMHGATPVARRSILTIRQYEHALRQVRAAVVAVLVDDEGLSLSAVARRLGVSRTVVSRLHTDMRGADQRP